MRISLPSGTPAELAVPEGQAELGLAICPDVMGLRPLFDDMAERLSAEHGWAVCVVEPFPGREAEDVQQRMGSPLGDSILDDLLAAADQCGTDRTAVLGFCLGGMVAFQAAALGRFDAAVSFYGMVRVPEPWRSPGMAEPLDALAEADAAPTLAIVAGRDKYAPADDVAALRDLGHVDIAFFPEADHGFVHDPARPAHRSGDAAEAWSRVIAFLATTTATTS